MKTVTLLTSLNLRNALNAIVRAQKEEVSNVEELRNAIQHIEREIRKLEGQPDPNQLDLFNKEGDNDGQS